jgi:hypothetical protein
VALIDLIIEAGQGLGEARAPEAGRIAEALQTNRILGILGEAEVGKTEVVRQALRSRPAGANLLLLDLDGAAGKEQLAFLMLKQIAAAFLGAPQFSVLSVGTLVPASVESERVELARLIGVDGLDEALREWPSGTFPLEKALAAVDAFARERDTILWVDHVEAPALTPRHPLDVDGVLWGLRATAQRRERLSLILSARSAFDTGLLGRDRAFYQQGRWLEIDNPAPPVWAQVGERLEVDSDLTAELFGLTRGHPGTMLRALPLAAATPGQRAAAEIIRDLASNSFPLAARATQHARSLHRLGSQVLLQLAMGRRPYAADQKGASPAQEIRKVLGRLHLAGLIRHDPGTWSVVDPLVGAVLRGEVHPAVAEDLP